MGKLLKRSMVLSLYALCIILFIFVYTYISNIFTDTHTSEISGNIMYVDCTKGAYNENGFYEISVRPDLTQKIMYTDYKSNTRTTLCFNANCTHDTNICNSYIDNNTALSSLSLNASNLICFYPGNKYMYEEVGEKALAKIEIRELNGSNPQTIYKFDPDIILYPNYAIDNTSIYVLEMHPEKKANVEFKYYLSRIDLISKKRTVIREFNMQMMSNVFIVGIYNNMFILKIIEPNQEYIKNTSAENFSYKELIKSQTHTLYSLSLDGEMKKLHQWTQGEKLEYITDNIICLIDKACNIYILDIETETLRKVGNIPNADMSACEIKWYINNNLIIDARKSEDMGYEINRYAIDLQTSNMTELLLKNNNDGRIYPVKILAFTNSNLLIGDESSTTYSTISYEDFFDSIPNYVTISTID